jgi:hypothetical protein
MSETEVRQKASETITTMFGELTKLDSENTLRVYKEIVRQMEVYIRHQQKHVDDSKTP